MKMKKKCTECGKPFVFSRGLCKYHWQIKYGKPIKKVSESMKQTLEEYRPIRKEFLKERPYCEAKLPGCTIYSTCVHHLKGKHSKELYLNTRYWKPSCVSCNNKIETLGEEAYKLGLKIRHNSK